MGTTLATYYAKLQDMPDSEYKVEILEDGPIKKIAVNGKIYEVDYNMGGDSIHSIIIDHHSHGVQISPSSSFLPHFVQNIFFPPLVFLYFKRIKSFASILVYKLITISKLIPLLIASFIQPHNQ